MSKPLIRNDLQGSKTLINFCDSAFALVESQQGNSLRYLKQTKARNTDVVYDGDNVCSQAGQSASDGKIGYGKEQVHLRRPDEQEEDHIVRQIKKLTAAGALIERLEER